MEHRGDRAPSIQTGTTSLPIALLKLNSVPRPRNSLRLVSQGLDLGYLDISFPGLRFKVLGKSHFPLSQNQALMRTMSHRSFSPFLSISPRQLDLVLLAGCSCLLTLLCQPMVSASSLSGNIGNYHSRIANASCILVCHKQQTEKSSRTQVLRNI